MHAKNFKETDTASTVLEEIPKDKKILDIFIK